jgi:hypothetical protein
VFLNLETERDCGLDETGTRMWQAVTAAPCIEADYAQLPSEIRHRGGSASSEFIETLRAAGR